MESPGDLPPRREPEECRAPNPVAVIDTVVRVADPAATVWGIAVMDGERVHRVLVAFETPKAADSFAVTDRLDCYQVVPLEFGVAARLAFVAS